MLVHAAAGGVGLLLGQWLKLLGATPIGTVGSAGKAASALANGYCARHRSIHAKTSSRACKRSPQPRGCDVVYDSVGQDTWRGSLKSLKRRGTFVSFGQSSGMIADFKLADLAAGGSLFATRPTLFDYIKSREELQARAADLFARLAAGADPRAHRSAPAAMRCRGGASRIGESPHHRRNGVARLVRLAYRPSAAEFGSSRALNCPRLRCRAAGRSIP